MLNQLLFIFKDKIGFLFFNRVFCLGGGTVFMLKLTYKKKTPLNSLLNNKAASSRFLIKNHGCSLFLYKKTTTYYSIIGNTVNYVCLLSKLPFLSYPITFIVKNMFIY